MSRALLVGVVLALASLAYVLYPLAGLRRRSRRGQIVTPTPVRTVTDEEIEAAVRAYRMTHTGPAECPVCGPRPEADADYCSSCGRRLDRAAEPS